MFAKTWAGRFFRKVPLIAAFLFFGAGIGVTLGVAFLGGHLLNAYPLLWDYFPIFLSGVTGIGMLGGIFGIVYFEQILGIYHPTDEHKIFGPVSRWLFQKRM